MRGAVSVIAGLLGLALAAPEAAAQCEAPDSAYVQLVDYHGTAERPLRLDLPDGTGSINALPVAEAFAWRVHLGWLQGTAPERIRPVVEGHTVRGAPAVRRETRANGTCIVHLQYRVVPVWRVRVSAAPAGQRIRVEGSIRAPDGRTETRFADTTSFTTPVAEIDRTLELELYPLPRKSYLIQLDYEAFEARSAIPHTRDEMWDRFCSAAPTCHRGLRQLLRKARIRADTLYFRLVPR